VPAAHESEATSAEQSVAREEKLLKNLTQTKCGENVGCRERVMDTKWRIKERLRGIWRKLKMVIPPPLRNVTMLMRQAGLNTMADTADLLYNDEERQLNQLYMDAEDCGTEECRVKFADQRQAIEMGRKNRLILLQKSLSTVGNATNRSSGNTSEAFPEKELFYVVMGILGAAALALLITTISLGGFWCRKQQRRKQKQPILRHVPMEEEWEWRAN
jgi:hypothetical protein